MQERALKVGVIGYGYSAKTFHLPFIEALDSLTLAAISSSQQQTVQQAHPQVAYFDTAERLITESDIELVIITAPNDVHFSLAKLALEQGKHVIVEKPFVTRIEQGKILIELAQQKNLVLSVFHNRRWDGDFLTIKTLIEDGRLGEIKLFESHFDRYRPIVRQRWREQAQEGGGILFDLAPHLLDQALALFGLPQSLSADCRIMRPEATTIDYFDLQLYYPQQVVRLHANLYSPEPNVRYQVLGSLGKFVKYGLDPQEDRLKAGVVPCTPEWAQETPEQFGVFYHAEGSEVIPTEQGGYQHYFQQVVAAIRDGKANPVSAESALRSIQLIELALESSAQGLRMAIAQDGE
ncbi:oxidoreductase [Vibrio sp. AH4]|uniref:oxidoreductase n=1 Tax=Vibrio sp. AH4 TaxID=2919577 RepID=UPI0027399649|nr:oxidoreductase [Vibrio sp. AH4]MDP4493539.1 oxidoreductase [Vibrio sp. AH4]